jgi:hypothetical protein
MNLEPNGKMIGRLQVGNVGKRFDLYPSRQRGEV